MRTWFGLLSSLFVLASGAAAQAPLYELASPNEESSGTFGQAVSGVGDVDGDGRGDFVVGSLDDPGASPSSAGRAYVFSGATGALLHTLVSPNEESNGLFGSSVSGAGDVDSDGRDDIIVGAEFEDPGASPSAAGRAYVFSGATGALLFTLMSPNEEQSGLFGSSVSGAGDVDGDGRADIAVGARFEDPGASPGAAGRVYVFSSATGGVLYTLVSPNEETSGAFGGSVSRSEDVDGDGREDIVVGARSEDPGASPSGAGRAYVFSGATGALLFTLASPNEELNGNFGDSVSV
ncbi:MAG: integrin alpha, partial [Bacteroidota bacterium]